MSPTLTLSPLPDSESPFTETRIKLHTKNKSYVIGFRHNPTRVSESGAKAKSYTYSVADIGFSSELEDDKLCIVPVDSDEARQMKDTFAAIWLAPGYKVMIIPAEGSKIYYQRALRGNSNWTRIKSGYGFDLADPLLSVLDGAIHIKFDTRPSKHKRDVFMHKLLKHLRRGRIDGHSSLVQHVHTEIGGEETHKDVRHYQIAAHVTVEWSSPERMPSRGDLALGILRPDDVPGGLKQNGINISEVGMGSNSSTDTENNVADEEEEHKKRHRKSREKSRSGRSKTQKDKTKTSRVKSPPKVPAISRVSREG